MLFIFFVSIRILSESSRLLSKRREKAKFQDSERKEGREEEEVLREGIYINHGVGFPWKNGKSPLAYFLRVYTWNPINEHYLGKVEAVQ